MDCKEIVITNGNLTATISSIGGELISYKKNNKESIWTGDASFWKGHAPILFPFCGGLINGDLYLKNKKYDMPKHGFIRFHEFEVVDKKDNQVTLCFKENKETKKIYPYDFTFVVTYTLTDVLNIKYEITNNSKEDMYFNVGSHEGYLLDDDFNNYHLEFNEEEDLKSIVLEGPLLSHESIDLGSKTRVFPLKYEDYKVDALVFPHIKSKRITLVNNSTGPVIDLEFDKADNLVLWTVPQARFICIEPWNGLHDYVDSELDIKKKNNVTILSSGNAYAFSHTIRIR